MTLINLQEKWPQKGIYGIIYPLLPIIVTILSKLTEKHMKRELPFNKALKNIISFYSDISRKTEVVDVHISFSLEMNRLSYESWSKGVSSWSVNHKVFVRVNAAIVKSDGFGYRENSDW